MQDPIADMLTRIRNAQAVGEKELILRSSRLKIAIIKVLKEEGYIDNYELLNERNKDLKITLKYYQNRPVIEKINRVSRAGLRIYKRCEELPVVLAGMGIAIVSTSKGVMTERTARTLKLGGEVLCTVE